VAAPEDRVPPPTTQGRSDLGPLSDFAADGVYDKFARTGQVMLIRKAGTLYVTSSICSHKRCVLKKKDDGLLCPCHQSQFNSDGIPLDGPAKTPLTRYGISLENNRVMVDTTKSFAEKEWAAEGALVKLPA
jgi:cytochrome b6-f complex iron-sulfur subunit